MSDEIKEKEAGIVKDILLGDVTDYSDTISEKVPEIVSEMKEKMAEEDQKDELEEGATLRDVPASILESYLHEELRYGTHLLVPNPKDEDRIKAQIKKKNPVNKAKGVAKQIGTKGKYFRRGKECMNSRREDMAKEYFIRLAEDCGLGVEDFVDKSSVKDTKEYKISKAQDLIDTLKNLKVVYGKVVANKGKVEDLDRLVEIAEVLGPALEEVTDELD